MVFARILALVTLLLAAGACTPANNPPQTAAAGPSSGAATLPREVERNVGPAYPSPALQAFVDRVGQKIVAKSGIPGSFRFYVLDQPVPNAHALSPGYVFITRGLLAMMDDEAELAAAFGHELGHVVLHHAAERERARRGVMDAAVDAAMVSGSVTVGRSVAREGLLALRRYSREQELEADRAGVGYLVQAGYRGDAMITLVEKLRRQAQLEDRLMGQTPDPGDQPGVLSTHPAPNERLEALHEIAATGAPGESDRADYLAAIDGMSVDDAPEEGFVHGATFLHPTMRLAFEAPRDFQLFNDHEGVLGVGRDRSLIYFSCRNERVLGRLDDWMRDKLKPTPTGIEATEIDGAEAAIGARPRGSDTGTGQLRHVIVRHGDGICYFNLLSQGPDRDRRIEALVAAARSFHSLSAADAAALRPYRLRVISPAGASPAALAARMAYGDLKLERLLTLNGVDTAAELAGRSQVKIVEP
ncbi:MAG: M48 family metalloprotease [Reyranellales bacterium]